MHKVKARFEPLVVRPSGVEVRGYYRGRPRLYLEVHNRRHKV
jgi:hypothetical protein